MKEKTADQLRAKLHESFDRWDYLLKHGCQDPFWPDGVNMNLVRNHIIWYYRQIEELAQEDTQMSLFGPTLRSTDRPVPPEVPDNYMAPNGDYPDRVFMRRNPPPAITHEWRINSER